MLQIVHVVTHSNKTATLKQQKENLSDITQSITDCSPDHNMLVWQHEHYLQFYVIYDLWVHGGWICISVVLLFFRFGHISFFLKLLWNMPKKWWLYKAAMTNYSLVVCLIHFIAFLLLTIDIHFLLLLIVGVYNTSASTLPGVFHLCTLKGLLKAIRTGGLTAVLGSAAVFLCKFSSTWLAKHHSDTDATLTQTPTNKMWKATICHNTPSGNKWTPGN